MNTQSFRAGVQYGDFKGSAAADRSDNYDLRKYLESQNLIQAGEFLIAVEMFSGEVHQPEQNKPVYVNALLTKHEKFETVKAAIESGQPLNVRRVRLELSLGQFFGMFKRFHICISNSGMLTDMQYTFEEE